MPGRVRGARRSLRGMSPRGVLVALALLVPVALAGCAGARQAMPTMHTSLVVVDPTRSTPARGTQPVLPQRTIPVSVVMPTGTGPWPLIVFAHGFDTSPADYQSLLDAWATAGYVVAAPTFPIATSAGSGPARRDDNWEEPWDISWTISGVLGDPTIAPHVDATKIGVAGHSDGGSAVAAMALNSLVYDHRVTAFLAMSGAIMTDGPYAAAPGGQWGPINQGALLAVSGDADPDYPWAMEVADWANLPNGTLTLLDGEHFAPYVDGGAMGDTVRFTTIDFFNRWLTGDGYAGWWLYHDGTTPGISRLDSGSL